MIYPVSAGQHPMVLFSAVPVPPEPTFAPNTTAECHAMLEHLPAEVSQALQATQQQHLRPIEHLMELNVQIGQSDGDMVLGSSLVLVFTGDVLNFSLKGFKSVLLIQILNLSTNIRLHYARPQLKLFSLVSQKTIPYMIT